MTWLQPNCRDMRRDNLRIGIALDKLDHAPDRLGGKATAELRGQLSRQRRDNFLPVLRADASLRMSCWILCPIRQYKWTRPELTVWATPSRAVSIKARRSASNRSSRVIFFGGPACFFLRDCFAMSEFHCREMSESLVNLYCEAGHVNQKPLFHALPATPFKSARAPSYVTANASAAASGFSPHASHACS